jgi:DNA-directed RNA polymerase specialized sigma24 family protein
MTKDLSLDPFLERYRNGELSRRDLEGKIIENILYFPRKFYLYDIRQDERIDFLAWFYSRLSRATENYRSGIASFTAYIMSLVRYSAREYQRREVEHRCIERIYWEAAAKDMAVHSEEPAYWDEEERFSEIGEKPVANPRQALILLLKSYNMVSDEFIARAAPALGIDSNKLFHLVEELRGMRFNRDAEIRAFRDRISSQFFRCQSFARQMLAAPEGSPRRLILQQRLARAEQRLENMKNYFKGFKSGASNRQIAEILGIPKGTVDSNLYAAKKRGYRQPGAENGGKDEKKRRPRGGAFGIAPVHP